MSFFVKKFRTQFFYFQLGEEFHCLQEIFDSRSESFKLLFSLYSSRFPKNSTFLIFFLATDVTDHFC